MTKAVPRLARETRTGFAKPILDWSTRTPQYQSGNSVKINRLHAYENLI